MAAAIADYTLRVVLGLAVVYVAFTVISDPAVGMVITTCAALTVFSGLYFAVHSAISLYLLRSK